MLQGNLATVLIIGIVFATACVAIVVLKNKPARIVAVIVALATLVGALVPLVKLLTQESHPTQVVAPENPGESTASRSQETTPPSSPTPGATTVSPPTMADPTTGPTPQSGEGK